MPSLKRPSRQTDFARFSSSTPIVIDNGSSTFRIGYEVPAAPALPKP
jgi:actin-related protein 5